MILIADSGSTKTDWRILKSGQPATSVQTVGFNPYYQDAASVAVELQISLLPHCQGKITHVFYYGTGVANDEKAEIIRTAISQIFDVSVSIEVHSDVLGAARAACGHQEGIGCILGTGSNSCYFDGQKIAFQIPPLGFWLGDEGSGGYLGKQLVLAYLHKEMPTEIRALFEEKYGAMDRLQVLENAYHKSFPNRYFASFSRFLSEHRQHDFCDSIIRDSFNLFFDKYILKYPDCHSLDLNFVGSVAFYYASLLRQVAESRNLRVGTILETPIEGLVNYHSEAYA